jgi:hypothetical protein
MNYTQKELADMSGFRDIYLDLNVDLVRSALKSQDAPDAGLACSFLSTDPSKYKVSFTSDLVPKTYKSVGVFLNVVAKTHGMVGNKWPEPGPLYGGDEAIYRASRHAKYAIDEIVVTRKVRMFLLSKNHDVSSLTVTVRPGRGNGKNRDITIKWAGVKTCASAKAFFNAYNKKYPGSNEDASASEGDSDAEETTSEDGPEGSVEYAPASDEENDTEIVMNDEGVQAVVQTDDVEVQAAMEVADKEVMTDPMVPIVLQINIADDKIAMVDAATQVDLAELSEPGPSAVREASPPAKRRASPPATPVKRKKAATPAPPTPPTRRSARNSARA